MRIFLTGATGFVGSAIVPELLKAGHQVLGLTRSEAGTDALIVAGAEAYRGELQDLDGLRRAVEVSDGVIHAAFDHDFSKFAQNCETDRRAIDAIGAELEGSVKPFIVTSGLPMTPGRLTSEEDVVAPGSSPRFSEQVANELIERGLCVSVVRMSQVHDRDKQGMASYMIEHARRTGVSAYIGSGENRWSAVHRLDAGAIYRLAIEKAKAGARYHAVSEQGVSVRDVAQAIGQGLNVPVRSMAPDEGAEHFAWLARPVSMDTPASSALTRVQLGWEKKESSGFLVDLQNSNLFKV